MRTRGRGDSVSEHGVFGLLHVSVVGGGWAEYGSVCGVGARAGSGGERAAYFAAGADQLRKKCCARLRCSVGLRV